MFCFFIINSKQSRTLEYFNTIYSSEFFWVKELSWLLHSKIWRVSISKVKRQPSEWEKIIANETTDKELISKIYKQLLQLCRWAHMPRTDASRFQAHEVAPWRLTVKPSEVVTPSQQLDHHLSGYPEPEHCAKLNHCLFLTLRRCVLC